MIRTILVKLIFHKYSRTINIEFERYTNKELVQILFS